MTVTPAPPPADPAPASPFHATNAAGLPDLLRANGISLVVSTYQANRLMAVREAEGSLWTVLRTFERPMGLAVRGDRQLVLGTRNQVWDFRNAPDIAARLEP